MSENRDLEADAIEIRLRATRRLVFSSLGSVLVGEDLEMVRVSDLLARIDVDQHGHWSLLSFLGPQWCFFPDSVNSRTLPRFNACMTPIRANIVGPLRDTSISTSIAVCHSGSADSFFGRPVI
jgi:hypothetical protein